MKRPGRRQRGLEIGILDAPSRAILSLLRDPPTRRAMGEALRERITSDYDRDTIITQYRKIYEGLSAGLHFPELR